MNHPDFVATYGPIAGDVADATGLHPDMVLGQMALESNWGAAGNNNPFGISPGGKVANYGSVPEGAQAYVDLVNKRYAAASQGAAPVDQAKIMAGLGYNSVDPNYATKVGDLAQSVKGMREAASAPTTDDLMKRIQGLTGQAVPAEPDAPSSDDLLARIQQVVPSQVQPAAPKGEPDLSQLPADPATMAQDMPVPTTAEGMRNWLAPAPGTTYGDVLPLARDDATGAIRPAMPNMLRSTLQGGVDLLQGPGGMVVDPSGNPLSARLTPQATSTLATIAALPSPAAGTGGAVAEAGANRLMQAQAPLSQEFLAAPVAPEARNALIAPPQGPVSAVSGASGLPVPSIAPTPSAAPVAVGSVVPKSSAEAKQVASAYYDLADQSGGTLTPQFTNKFVDSVAEKAPQTEAGQAVAGQSAVSGLVDRLQALRDKPMTLQGAQEVDEALGGLIDQQYGVRGLSKEGKQIADVQQSFRDQIANAEPGDVEGGSTGFNALGPARQAWAQAMKMSDLERIQTRADMTDNPATSVRTQIRTLLTNATKSRGYSDEERSALEDAASRGALGGALHVFGSRLVPLVALAAETGMHGLGGGLIGAGVAHVVAGRMRNAASSLAQSRLDNAMAILGKRVPPMPSQNLLMPPP